MPLLLGAVVTAGPGGILDREVGERSGASGADSTCRSRLDQKLPLPYQTFCPVVSGFYLVAVLLLFGYKLPVYRALMVG